MVYRADKIVKCNHLKKFNKSQEAGLMCQECDITNSDVTKSEYLMSCCLPCAALMRVFLLSAASILQQYKKKNKKRELYLL